MESLALEKWIPIDNLNNAYDLDEIKWGEDGISFVMILDGKQIEQNDIRRFSLTWDSSHIISYHVTDETYRSDCWNLDFKNDGRFYIIKNSKYIEILKQKSPLLPDDVIHFLIVGTNTIVDVLAKAYPSVIVLE